MKKLRKGAKDWAIGYKWGSLEIISERRVDEKIVGKKRKGYFLCKCDCGKEVKVRVDWIDKQMVKSCGCKHAFYTSLNHNKFKCSLLDETGKICGKCKVKQPAENFTKTKKNKDKLSCLCQKCKRGPRLEKEYGLTYEQYQELFRKQNNACACCGTTKSYKFCVDHCHKIEKETGKIVVRGILCTNCNSGIGLLGDNLENILKAVKYLRKFENKIKKLKKD